MMASTPDCRITPTAKKTQRANEGVMAAEKGPWPLIELKDMGNSKREREERQVQGDWKQRVRRVGGGCKR